MGKWRSAFVVKLLLMPSMNSVLIAINSNSVCSWGVNSTSCLYTPNSTLFCYFLFSHLAAFAAYCMLFRIPFEAWSYQTGLAVSEDTFVRPIRALPGTDGAPRSLGRILGRIWALKKHNSYSRVGKQHTRCVCVCVCVCVCFCVAIPSGLNIPSDNKNTFWTTIPVKYV